MASITRPPQTQEAGSRSRSSLLSALLASPELAFLMEAHDGLSAKIVQEAGFPAIWASGLTMSTALGVRDNNEASWTQVLEVLEFMADATSIPILVDGDTGYGNFNNMRRLVQKLCQRSIAGVCIEDKLFPKTNSFIGEGQPLADIDEFCGKIKAGKDSQTDGDFQIVARVEALISGWGMEEALKRAEAYRDAGADAILIHSKATNANEILTFAREWADRAPLVIVPTTYASTPTQAFRDAGISAVIWANHNLRAAISAMRETSRTIFEEESLSGVEGRIAKLRDVFDLAGNTELADAERRYLPAARANVQGIVLAASRGSALGALTEDKPKSMIDIHGQPLLHRLVSTLRECGVREIAVVRGYRKEAIDLPSIAKVDNVDYDTTGEVASLACAADRIAGDCLIAYGDILFRRYLLDNLMDSEGDIVVAVDALWHERRGRADGRFRDLVTCSRPFTGDYLDDAPVSLEKMADGLDDDSVSGEWIGLARLSAKGATLVRDEIAAMQADGSAAKSGLPDLFTRLAAKGHDVRVMYVTGHWLDIDDAFDLATARNFL